MTDSVHDLVEALDEDGFSAIITTIIPPDQGDGPPIKAEDIPAEAIKQMLLDAGAILTCGNHFHIVTVLGVYEEDEGSDRVLH